VDAKNRNPLSQPDLSKIEQRRRTLCDRQEAADSAMLTVQATNALRALFARAKLL